MIRDDWESICTLEEKDLPIGYPWYFVTEIIGDWTILRFAATGSWACLGQAIKACGPDGHPGLPIAAERLLLPSSCPGTLLGKFGGSTASLNDNAAFAIGACCYTPMPEKKNCQLFISINGARPVSTNVLDLIRLEIFGAVDQ
ncbi:hypothetical protein SAMN04487926_11618 [Paraburkholderia steynii]|uniref:Uncharacterized protein n=1 Tax=Paraburkholderia steynii TaxID=1245441 RepID=A0A7Z7BA43_9BURK|nr:hypothetical protein [Paraburkholderia steynii]SDI38659.1 hypothetical protein SAMN04487926_11618 [Paraburkholderia steynii]